MTLLSRMLAIRALLNILIISLSVVSQVFEISNLVLSNPVFAITVTSIVNFILSLFNTRKVAKVEEYNEEYNRSLQEKLVRHSEWTKKAYDLLSSKLKNVTLNEIQNAFKR